MLIPTKDPNVFIIEQTTNRKVYQTTQGETWEILGTCNMCGLCEVGGNDPDIVWNPLVEPGQPNACYAKSGEDRLDNPVRPNINSIFSQCALSGKYL